VNVQAKGTALPTRAVSAADVGVAVATTRQSADAIAINVFNIRCFIVRLLPALHMCRQ
jgi:hypothetical protein